MKQDIAIYGAGGLGREFALLFSQIDPLKESWNFIGFFDDHIAAKTSVDDARVLGNFQTAQEWKNPLALVLAIADPQIRFVLRGRFINPKLSFPTLIHPQSNVGDMTRNQFGKGVIITAGVILTTGITLGDFVIVNLATTIGHDVTVGAYSSVMPGCSISGNVQIGEKSVVGTGARILQNISIGAQSVIGAGAVVTKSFPVKSKLIGIPATNRAR